MIMKLRFHRLAFRGHLLYSQHRPAGGFLSEALRRFVAFVHELRKFLTFSVAIAAINTPSGFGQEVYLFGDSAVDMGNLNAIPAYAPGPNAPYYRGPDGFIRLCNGPMWPERLFPGLQVITDPHRQGQRVNFAYGGAKTDDSSAGIDPVLPVGVQSQITTFAAEVAAGRLRPTARSWFVIEAGPNDYFEGLAVGEDPSAIGDRVAANLAVAVGRLAQLGARTVFVCDLPDFGEAPLFQSVYSSLPADQAAQLRAAFNQITADGRSRIRAALTAEKALVGSGVNIVAIPINTLYRAVLAHPAAFGFTNVTGQIYDDVNDRLLVSDPRGQDGYMFVDSLHLSARAQQWEARYYGQVVDAVAGGPQRRLARVVDAAWSGSETIGRALFERSRRQPLGATAVPRHWEAFLATTAGLSQLDALPGEERARIGTGAVVVGVSRPDEAGLGLTFALGYFGQEGRVDDRALRFDQRSVDLTLRGERRLGGLLFRSSAEIARLDLDTRRDPAIPTMLARGSTGGWMTRATLAAGSGFAHPWIAGAWEVGLAYDTVALDGFAESGAPGLNLRYQQIEHAVLRTFATARVDVAELKLGPVVARPALWLGINYEPGDRTTAVEAELIDNLAGPIRGIAAQGRRLHALVEPRLEFLLGSRVDIVLSYRLETDADKLNRQGFWLGINGRF
jgi:hypothetical protein